ncbi:MAG: hypothetical protein WDK96_00635 [Candidatus Paceibacterota bacterium]|jgi:hypothetical protein
MSIKDLYEKIKVFSDTEKGRNLYTIFIIILVAFSSFGLGRLSKIKDSTQNWENQANLINTTKEEGMGLKTQNIALESTLNGQNTSNKPFVASSRGNKYYPTSCSQAKQLSSKNKIYFGSEEEAQKLGYTRSTSCN